MQHNSMQILDEWDLVVVGESAWVARLAPEFSFVGRQPVRFKLDRPSILVLAYQHKVPVVSYQHLPVFVPISRYLGTVRGNPGIVAGGFHFDNAPIRRLAR